MGADRELSDYRSIPALRKGSAGVAAVYAAVCDQAASTIGKNALSSAGVPCCGCTVTVIAALSAGVGPR